jgi:NAD+ kinase
MSASITGETGFRSIGLVGRQGNSCVADSLLVLVRFLRGRHYDVVLAADIAESLPAAITDGVRACPRDALGDVCDLVIVVGGDGSMLGAARALSGQDVAVLGINRGSLGFLTDIAPDEIETRVTDVLEGRYVSEERFLLDAVVLREGSVLARSSALNEVVLHRGSSLRMIEFELYLDNHFVYSQHSDGLVVSTPTGSTAYALSGGGPILHPALDAIALVPVFPHTLTSRPVVVSSKTGIRILLKEFSGGQPVLTCDGQVHVTLQIGDVIEVARQPGCLRLIHPVGYNYYDTCRAKLGWGSRLV